MNPHEIISQISSHFPPLVADNAPFYIFNLIIFIGILQISAIVIQLIRMILVLVLNKQLARVSSPYSSKMVADKKILILGDSTAVGTGADKPEETFAGMLAHDFPNSQIINLGVNGAITSGLIHQINQVKGQKFDMIVISIGGNDVWSLISLKKIKSSLEECFEETKLMSDKKVIFLMYNNIGSAPIFPVFIQYLIKRRVKRIQDVISEVTGRADIPMIDLFSKSEDNPFIKTPEKLFARDGVHPNSAGYRMWYKRMWRKMTEIGFLYKE